MGVLLDLHVKQYGVIQQIAVVRLLMNTVTVMYVFLQETQENAILMQIVEKG